MVIYLCSCMLIRPRQGTSSLLVDVALGKLSTYWLTYPRCTCTYEGGGGIHFTTHHHVDVIHIKYCMKDLVPERKIPFNDQ